MSIKDGLAGGVKSASFPTIGTYVEGEVISANIRQAIDMKTKKPEVWDDGSPKNNFVFELQTGQRDPQVENDNGVRAVYLKVSGSDKAAVKKALADVGADDVYPGGFMRVTYVGDEASSVAGFDPKKIKEVQYRPPQGSVGQAAEAPAQNFQPQQVQQQAPQGQQWGQNPQQAQQGFQPQGQPQQNAPQQGQSPWGNQQPQQVQQPQQAQPQQASFDGQQQSGDGLSF